MNYLLKRAKSGGEMAEQWRPAPDCAMISGRKNLVVLDGNRQMYVASDPYFTITFDEHEMLTVDAALAHYQAYCRKALEQGVRAPFYAIDKDIDWIRNELHRDDAAPLLGLHEKSMLGKVLEHYRAHRREDAPGAAAPFWAHDEFIERVLRRLWGGPPAREG